MRAVSWFGASCWPSVIPSNMWKDSKVELQKRIGQDIEKINLSELTSDRGVKNHTVSYSKYAYNKNYI